MTWAGFYSSACVVALFIAAAFMFAKEQSVANTFLLYAVLFQLFLAQENRLS